MGVLNRLTRRSDGERRFSLVAPAPTAPAAGAARGTPAGVAVMPLALRAGAVAALTRAERVAAAVTEPLTTVLPGCAAGAGTTGVAVGLHAAPVAPVAPPAQAGYAVLDVVTSGMSPEHDRVLELAVVRLDADGAVVGEWSTLLRPSVRGTAAPAGDAEVRRTDLTALAAALGVTARELAAAPTLADVAAELVAELSGRVLVAHGVAADLAFLRAELSRCGVVLPLAPTLCTLEGSWRHLTGLPRRRLSDCCEAAGVALDGVPTALTDARAAAGLLQRFLARGGDAGERGDAQAALVTRAAAVTWPDVEVPPRSSAAPRTGAQPSMADVPGRLAVVIESLPLDGPDLPLPAVAGHVELLAAALAAGPFDQGSARALALLADAANLTRAQVRAASRGVLLALAGAVGADSSAGEAERAAVMEAAAVLAVDADDVAARMAAAAMATGSLTAVAARPAGTDVRDGGWGTVAGLVLPEIPTPRAAPARVVAAAPVDAPPVDAAPVDAAPVDAPPVDATPGLDAAPALAAPEPSADVLSSPLDLREADARAAVRSWARARGMAVSDRGRLPRAVVEAYGAAHGELVAAR